MRIPIREQLGALVLLTTLTALAVISIASWIVNYNRITNLRTQDLALIAALKAAQLSSNLDLMERSVRSLATRVKLQNTLMAYNNGSDASSAFASFATDLASALTAPQQDILTLQAMLFNAYSGGSGVGASLLNVTGSNLNIKLPNGAFLGDAVGGYPVSLYPNLTYAADPDGRLYAYYLGEKLDVDAGVFLGPLQTNATYALSSITLPVINNSSMTGIIGYMTVVLDSRLITDVLNSPVGLGQTGVMLLIGPATRNNDFPGHNYVEILPFVDFVDTNQMVHFVLPPNETYKNPRHAERAYGTAQAPFSMKSFPTVVDAVTSDTGQINNQGGDISTTNEQGLGVSVGYAVPSTRLVDWILLVEESKSEVWQPINMLRRVLIGCVFGTALGIILLTLPLAHYSSRPIRRLRDATARSVIRLDTRTSTVNERNEKDPDASVGTSSTDSALASAQTDGSTADKSSWVFWKPQRPTAARDSSYRSTLKKQYPIPETVKARRVFVQDELTDLTQYFNEMSDELVLFYGKLEERVRQRTAELEAAKKAAEAANESKTLFIANISHELKTPLNGILGMTAVCIQEEDKEKIKRSLSIIYKSGDLLHNLLTDLLTFSKNQTNQIQLVEAEFPLRDIGTQIRAIFQNQAREGRVNFNISYEGCRDALGSTENTADKQYGPPGTGRVKDMQVWGDMQRILQVVINLTSNSLKFTPPEGSVSLRIRVLDNEVAESVQTGGVSPSRRSSNQSKTKKYPRLRILSRSDSDTSPISELPYQHSQPTLVEVPSKEDNWSRHSVASSTHHDPSSTTNNAPFNTHPLRFEFEIEDTGPGIAKHLQTKIFEPFVQGDLRLTKKFGGTGLGLSICNQLAKLMHGSISLDSTEGVGSKFTLHVPLKLVRTRSDSNATSPRNSGSGSARSSISIDHAVFTQALRHHTSDTHQPIAPAAPTQQPPRKASTDYFDNADSRTHLVGLSNPYFSTSKAPMASPNAEDAAQAKSSRLRVLVAEDNSINQEVVVRMLRLEEIFDVQLAKDGQEALDKVKESMEKGTPYDLIFMDVQMPNLDGRESTREIRKIGYNAPIVALTAFADEINRKECIESGMSDFMAKPIKRPALKHVLKTYCPPPSIAEVDEGDVSGVSEVGKGKEKGRERGGRGEEEMVSPGTEVPLLKHAA